MYFCGAIKKQRIWKIKTDKQPFLLVILLAKVSFKIIGWLQKRKNNKNFKN